MPLLVTSGAARVTGGGGNPPGWDPAFKTASITLSNNNRVATATANANADTRGIHPHATAKWGFEVTITGQATPGSQTPAVGVVDSSWPNSGQIGDSTHSIGYIANGAVKFNGATLATIDAFAAGDVIHVEADLAAQTAWFQKLGGTGRKGPYSFATMGATAYPGSWLASIGDIITLNTGGQAFSIALTAGFSPWN